ncbi:Uncharacterised protein [Orientia tsutsugamushi]|uniref:Uncharacterized protein n=1 Tax=Orientia tsutsugamushi TaxID=784 RepID=A0A2U3QVQ7_ORITS|nr:Uncharacterised protein [Orientia tsutsugamushi]
MNKLFLIYACMLYAAQGMFFIDEIQQHALHILLNKDI